MPSDRPDSKATVDNDPLAKSLVKINQELSKVISNLGANQSASSTPVPGPNQSGNKTVYCTHKATAKEKKYCFKRCLIFYIEIINFSSFFFEYQNIYVDILLVCCIM